tara:strand:- start:842 stop:1135 length:294 start_codon:yes stop_codon:yes gene_type:complete
MKNILIFCLCLINGHALADHHGQEKSALLNSFKTADRDSDNTLNRDEFTAFVAMNAEADIRQFVMIQRRGMQAIAFSRMDRDEDDKVTLQELRAMRR